MPPVVKLRSPIKLKGRVSTYSVTVLKDDQGKYVKTTSSFHVKIRLSKLTLLSLDNDSDLSSLDQELNRALEDTQQTQVDPEFLVSFHYKPKATGRRPSLEPVVLVPVVLEPVVLVPVVLSLTSVPLSAPLTAPSPSPQAHPQTPTKSEPTAKLEPKTQSPSPHPSHVKVKTEPQYRTIPPNLIPVLKREFGLLNETMEELEMIEKIIFTLRDPLTATKIRLPVKTLTCHHFECFDFENFCVFNHLPPGVRNALRKGLIKKSIDMKKRDKLIYDTTMKGGSQTEITKAEMASLSEVFKYQPSFNVNPGFKPHPMYKCPVCNKSFELNQLFISDIFNFFVKCTPADINRIELRDMMEYRIVPEDEVKVTKKHHTPEVDDVIVLSDSEEDKSSELVRGSASGPSGPSGSTGSTGSTGPSGSSGPNGPSNTSTGTAPSNLPLASLFHKEPSVSSDFSSDREFLELLGIGLDKAGEYASTDSEETDEENWHMPGGSGTWEDPVTLD